MKKFILIIVLLVSTTLISCEQKQENKITIAEVTHSVFYAPQYVAISEGIFKKYGIEVDLVLAPGADKVMSALLSGDAQIGLMGPEASVYVYNQGRTDYAINFAQLTQKDGSFLVGRNKIEDFSWDKVKDSTIIGGRKGGMPEMTLEYVLKSQGVAMGQDDPKASVNVRTDIQFAAMSGAFINGEGDYVALFEPTATILEKEGKGHVVASIGEYAKELPYTCYSSTKSYIQSNRSLIENFTKAVYEAQTWVYSHTNEEIATSIQEYFKELEYADLVKIVKRYRDIEAWGKSPLFTEASMQKLMDIMLLASEITSRADYSEIVDTSFANKVTAK